MRKFLIINLFFLLLFTTHAQASLVKLYEESNGSLGHSITYNVDDVKIEISAYYYDGVTGEIDSALVAGIDGVANKRHPAGIGVAKSEAYNPPGIDNVGGVNVAGEEHPLYEFLIFTFDKKVNINSVETSGLGPHGTNVEYWGGEMLGSISKISDLGAVYFFDDTLSGFNPGEVLGDVSWFAIGAKPEEDFNVFSIQTVQFSVVPSQVPVPAAFWLFLTGLLGLGKNQIIQKLNNVRV